MRMQVRFLASLSGLRIERCHNLQHRLQMQVGSGVAAAVYSLWAAPIGSLAQKIPYTVDVALKRKKEKKKKRNNIKAPTKHIFLSMPSKITRDWNLEIKVQLTDYKHIYKQELYVKITPQSLCSNRKCSGLSHGRDKGGQFPSALPVHERP